jgi:hypothetical protein
VGNDWCSNPDTSRATLNYKLRLGASDARSRRIAASRSRSSQRRQCDQDCDAQQQQPLHFRIMGECGGGVEITGDISFPVMRYVG